MRTCAECGTSTSNSKFCSRSCAAKFNNRAAPKRRKNPNRGYPCINCGTRSRNSKWCTNACRHRGTRNELLQLWVSGIDPDLGSEPSGRLRYAARELFKELNGNKCSKCGWSERHPIHGNVPVEIDHVDGNYRNNAYANLQLLCPNCHSLTPTFRALNIASVRARRRADAL